MQSPLLRIAVAELVHERVVAGTGWLIPRTRRVCGGIFGALHPGAPPCRLSSGPHGARPGGGWNRRTRPPARSQRPVRRGPWTELI